MKKVIYTGKAKEDLVKTLKEKRESLRQRNFGIAGSKTKNVKESANMRKEIARILTELAK